MNISQAADACGLPVKTLRYYETLELVVPCRHPGNDYREYSPDNIRDLCFLQRARAAGFSLAECRELLIHYRGESGAIRQQWLQERIGSLDIRMAVLSNMRQTLVDMLHAGEGAGTDAHQAETEPPQGMPFLVLGSHEFGDNR